MSARPPATLGSPVPADSAPPAAVACRALRAGYPGAPVLDDVSFTVTAGEAVGLVGPNGAGKTTLFRVLTGLLAPAAGQVTLFGRDLARLPAAERARLVGVVPQEVDSPMAFTVREIVMMGRTARLSRWRSPAAEDEARVLDAMQVADVAHLAERPFPALSGGEKQRALIAMVLAQDPRLILLDEATSHLDLSHRFEVLELVERLNRERGVTVLMSSHDLGLTAEFSRRLLVLERGRLAADGPVEQVLATDVLSRVFRCDVRARRDPETGTLAVFAVRAGHRREA